MYEYEVYFTMPATSAPKITPLYRFEPYLYNIPSRAHRAPPLVNLVNGRTPYFRDRVDLFPGTPQPDAQTDTTLTDITCTVYATSTTVIHTEQCSTSFASKPE